MSRIKSLVFDDQLQFRTFPEVVIQRSVSHSTLLRLQRDPARFLQWCRLRTILKPHCRTSHVWEDPIDGTPLESHRFKIDEWICSFIVERGEISEWSFSHITCDN